MHQIRQIVNREKIVKSTASITHREPTASGSTYSSSSINISYSYGRPRTTTVVLFVILQCTASAAGTTAVPDEIPVSNSQHLHIFSSSQIQLWDLTWFDRKKQWLIGEYFVSSANHIINECHKGWLSWPPHETCVVVVVVVVLALSSLSARNSKQSSNRTMVPRNGCHTAVNNTTKQCSTLTLLLLLLSLLLFYNDDDLTALLSTSFIRGSRNVTATQQP